MKTIIWGTLIFAACFFAQIALWRIRLPSRQTKTLLMIFFGGLIVSLAALAAGFSPAGISGPCGAAEFSHIFLFVSSLTLAYMITYSAIEADSPSLVIVLKIADAGTSGLAQDEFKKFMSDDLLVIPRINDLLTDKMAYKDGEKYRLTKKGVLFAKIFITYRAILGKTDKGG